MLFLQVVLSLFLSAAPTFADKPGHGQKPETVLGSDANAAQVFKCLAGIKKAGGLPESIEIGEANSGAVHFCSWIVTKDGFYRYELPYMTSDSNSTGYSQLGWLVEKRDYKLTLPNSKKKVRLAKLGGFESLERGVAITPFCNKEEDLPELPLMKLDSGAPELDSLSPCIKNALINATSQRIRALVNGVNERSKDSKAETSKIEFRKELSRLGWPNSLKEKIESWVEPCNILLSPEDKSDFFGTPESPGYIAETKDLKIP